MGSSGVVLVLACCPEFRPPEINFTTRAQKYGTMMIILSASSRCGDQPSSSPENHRPTVRLQARQSAECRSCGNCCKEKDLARRKLRDRRLSALVAALALESPSLASCVFASEDGLVRGSTRGPHAGSSFKNVWIPDHRKATQHSKAAGNNQSIPANLSSR